MTEQKFNIIGDIHGNTCWKQLVLSDAINVFVGDYFSPYKKEYNFEHCKKNFLEIIRYKQENPRTVLLLGNHDFENWHWLKSPDGCYRLDLLDKNREEIFNLFEEHKDLFSVAYSADNQYLISHAGVSAVWMWRMMCLLQTDLQHYQLPLDYINLEYPEAEKFANLEIAYADQQEYFKKLHDEQNSYIPKELQREYKEPQNQLAFFKSCWYHPLLNKVGDEYQMLKTKYGHTMFASFRFDPNAVANFVNSVYQKDPQLFKWKLNATINDYCGNSIGQSPVWLRPPNVFEANIFRGSREFRQVVGHTRWWEDSGIYTNSWKEDNRQIKEIVFVDCLEKNPNSFTFTC